MAGLQVGQALRCSSYLGLESAVPVLMFLDTQPPYASKGLTDNSSIPDEVLYYGQDIILSHGQFKGPVII